MLEVTSVSQSSKVGCYAAVLHCGCVPLHHVNTATASASLWELFNLLKVWTGHEVLTAASAEETHCLWADYFFTPLVFFFRPPPKRHATTLCLQAATCSPPQLSALRHQPDEGVPRVGCQLPGAALNLLQENLKWTSVSFLFLSSSSRHSQADSHFTSYPRPLSCSVKCWGADGRWKWRFSTGKLLTQRSEIFTAADSYFVHVSAQENCRLASVSHYWTDYHPLP